MDDQIQERVQTCEQEGPGYFLNSGVTDKMRGSLVAIYSQLLVVKKQSFFQIQPLWPEAPAV